MRLVYDLFPCQTGSRFRGIGRFTLSLLEAMARSRRGHDLYALANSFHPESVEELRQQLRPLLSPGHFSTYSYIDRRSLGCDNTIHAAVANALIQHAYQALAPDALIYSTPFEGWGEEGVIALPHGNVPGALRVAVLYDFIPWLFPEQYLHTASGYRKWYERRLMSLHKFDLLLAISEATRRDAIRILGISPDQVVNISGAASEKFRPMTRAEQAKQEITRFGIARPFVLYTGNADHRKNLQGMLKAYALLPRDLRRMHQLVLNQVGEDIPGFRSEVRALGLTDDEVVITGRITDDELICLYTRCKVFVFPSLYEGFGLPILEAMACGAPVIAADNSSIPEVVGRSDVLFDASNPASIADVLKNVLSNDGFRSELVSYSIERAKLFSWDRSANLAWDAIEASLTARRAAAARNCLDRLPKPRIAVVCPLSSEDDVSTQHCVALLPLLSHYFEIDLFTEEGSQANAPLLEAAFKIYPHTALIRQQDRYATIVYQLANSASHGYMLPLMGQCMGVVVMHEAPLNEAIKALVPESDVPSALVREIVYSHGLRGLIMYLKHGDSDDALFRSRHVLEFARHVVFPDAERALKPVWPDAWLPPSTILPAGDPASTGLAYAQAIHAAMASTPADTVKCVADALESAAPNESALSAIAGYADYNWRLRRQPRLLIDVTQLTKVDAFSGIQRVVKKIAYEIGQMGNDDLNQPFDLVHLANGKLWRASTVIASIFEADRQTIPEEEISIHPGDTLLMLDSSWEQYGDFTPVFENVRQSGGKIITVVYDLIPLRFPEMCAAPLVQVFQRWIRMAAEQSDMLLCISRAVADDTTAYLAEQKLTLPRKLSITFWHLGADLNTSEAETLIRPQVDQITAEGQSALFLMVGTIEPRKGHDFVLDAFETLWRNDADMRLCIAGKEGWMVDKTMRRLREHPQLNKKLFLIERFTDAEINRCYAAATALIAASSAEGFGLPIVEAALHKVPVVASDIPVFREVGGDGARYFSLDSPQYLADAVKAMSQMPADEKTSMAMKIRTLTWNESAKELLVRIGILQ